MPQQFLYVEDTYCLHGIVYAPGFFSMRVSGSLGRYSSTHALIGQ